MKKNTAAVSVCVLALMVVTAGTVNAHKDMSAEKSFEHLKMLKGEWEGINPAGTPVTVTYEVYSGGSAVMEKLQPQGEPSMITVYHMDDGTLMMTHYCSAGNQPRMKGTVAGQDERRIDFVFVEGTNIKSTHSNGHMQSMSIFLKDNDHVEQTWTFRKDGKDEAGTFQLTRKS